MTADPSSQILPKACWLGRSLSPPWLTDRAKIFKQTGMRPLFLLVCLLSITHQVSAQKAKPTPQPIIDMHMHVYAADERWAHKVPNPINNQPMVATTEQAHMEATMAQMDRYNVVKAVISGNETDYDAALRWKAKAPGRFIVSYGFDNPAKADLEFIRKEAKAGRLHGI